MFKRLFGGKKNKAESLDDAKKNLLENIVEETQPKKLTESIELCLDFLKEGTSDDIEDIKNVVFQLTQSDSAAQTSKAFSVYSNLLERVHTTEADVRRAIELYTANLDQAIPFFNLLEEEVKKAEEGDEYYSVDIDEIYKQLISDRELVSEETAKSAVLIDSLAQNLVNILSADPHYIKLAKASLQEKVKQIRDYNQGAFLLEKLFNVVYDDPIVVIDVDNHIGIEGKMGGVSDNYQLHLLLMGLPELNPIPAINEDALSIAKGEGIHISNLVVEYKWNMYRYEVTDQEAWDEIKIGPAKTIELKDFWLEGDTMPQEISVHNGKRVLLLGRSPMKRNSRLQRTFKNMKASIKVEKVLTKEEIDQWLKFS